MNKSIRFTLSAALAASMLFPGDGVAQTMGAAGGIIVANRNGGSISVTDVLTSKVTNVELPAAAATPEPMYVVHSLGTGRLFVGDRANSRVVAFNPSTFCVIGIVPTGEGVFHMWGEDTTRQLWVVNDVDKTISVIDMATLGVVSTFPTPADLNALGGKPHDVVLDPSGEFGYVSMIGVSGPNDFVVKFSATTFLEVDRAAVGKDPHLGLGAANNKLFVPTQGAHEVAVLSRATLDLVASVPVRNAHGARMSDDGSVFYTTNIADGGKGGVVAIDATTATVLWTLDVPLGTPHNIALAPDGSKLYVTHSGPASDKVSIIDLSSPNEPRFVQSVTVGLNPWGIATAPGRCEADFNRDGTLNSQDFFDFLTAFFGGCQ